MVTTSPLIQIGASLRRPEDEPVDPQVIAEIKKLKVEKNAVIMAHNYQIPAIQDVADFVGDSLGLAREATKVDADVIILCGVYFMAETAKILNPKRKVVIPDADAGCSLADSITPEQLRAWKAEHPGAIVVSYVNTTAAVKAETDICCTSGNAEAVIRSIPEDQEILFCPDMFLGDNLRRMTGRKNMLVWAGECHVHAGIRPDQVRQQLEENPNVDLMIHPECGCSSNLVWARGRGDLPPENTFLLSTEGMLRHVDKSNKPAFIVGTETGLLHRLRNEHPEKQFYAADERAVCKYMKMITVPKLLNSLKTLQPEVIIPEHIRVKALASIERMIAIH